MRALRAHRTTSTLAARADQYADKRADKGAEDETFTIPEDLGTLSDAEVAELHAQSVDAFKAMYGDGSDLNDEDLTALAALTEGIEGVKEELSTRQAAAAERREKAAELAAKVAPEDAEDEEDADEEPSEDADGAEADEDDEEKDEDAEAKDEESAAETVVAAAAPRKRGPVSVSMARAKRHLPKARQESGTPTRMQDVAFAAGEGSGYAAGDGIDFNDAGNIVNRRLATVNETAVRAAHRAGRTVRQQMGVMSIRKPIPEDLVIGNNDAMHVEDVLRRAASESRLQGNSLVAAGGWCAPSETLYDLLELESRDGIFSLPEVGMARGGISRTLGPDFASIFNDVVGFHYTEDQDIAGNYGVDADGNGDGSAGGKPCYRIECPEFEEFRLEVDGLCITAGLLQQKGYPEVIARTVRGALIAHDHRMAARVLRAVAAGSTAVAMPTEGGTTAPLLRAIELQGEHVRYLHRLGRGTTLEAVFPYWVRGAIRSDLSKRNGVELLSVTDAQINGWFSARGIAPQFVYNWQDINTIEAAQFTGWPTEVSFLMYPAGSWVRGSSDIITMDTLIDSTLLAQNDFTALFTEEGYAVVPMGNDSRVISVPLDDSGVTGIQAELGGNGVSLTPGTTPEDPEGE